MKTLYLRFTLLLLATLAISCVGNAQKSGRSSGKEPAWVNNPYTGAYKSDYLLAVGSASNQQDAQNTALANLSRIFQSEINADETLIDDLREFNQQSSNQFERTTQLLSVTRIGSRQNLVNAKILESYVSKDGTVYALAGMKRRETAQLYTAEISNNELKISSLEDDSKKSTDAVSTLALLKRALILSKVNDNLGAQLAILQERPASTMNTLKTVELERQIEKTIEQCLVYLEGEDTPDAVRAAVASVFQKEGFSVIDSPQRAIIVAKVHFSTEEANLSRQDARFAYWKLNIEMMHNVKKQDFRSYAKEGREGALSQKDAILRAEFTARKMIDTDFHRFVQNELLTVN